MLKKWLCILCCLTILTGILPVWAEEADDPAEEEETSLSEDELAQLQALDDVVDEDAPVHAVGPVYEEMTLKDFNQQSPALYTCRVKERSSIYSQRSMDSKKVTYNDPAVTADVLYVGSVWVIVRYKQYIGYIKRSQISNIVAVDTVNTPPYGVSKHQYIATTADVCEVRKSMSDQDESWVVLNPGTMLSIWQISDGWAIVPYWRTYGYIDLHDLTDLIPVSPTDVPLNDDTPIAAYTSYYTMADTEINHGRIINISVACRRLTGVLQPGESFNFNKDVGPYKKALGYQPAWVLVDGTSKPGYGGGTCQVSSTLYNALLQLPGVEILQRRPHGPGGAKYLPHGVDAAVGNDQLNLRFKNNYDFPIRLEGHTSDDGALLMLVYKEE